MSPVRRFIKVQVLWDCFVKLLSWMLFFRCSCISFLFSHHILSFFPFFFLPHLLFFQFFFCLFIYVCLFVHVFVHSFIIHSCLFICPSTPSFFLSFFLFCLLFFLLLLILSCVCLLLLYFCSIFFLFFFLSFFFLSFFLSFLILFISPSVLLSFFLTPYIQMVVISASRLSKNDTTKQRHVDRLLSLITLPFDQTAVLFDLEKAWSFPQSLSHSEHPERLFPHFHGGIESQRPPHTPSSATAVTLQALFSSCVKPAQTNLI